MESEPFSSFASPLRSVPAGDSPGRERSERVGDHDRATVRHLIIGGALVAVLLAAVAVLLTSESNGPSNRTPNPASAGTLRTASGLLATGAMAQMTGHAALAQSSYAAALRLEPSNATVVYDLGTLAQQDHKTTSALGYYNQALVDDPDMTPAMFNKAILVATTDPAEAAVIYQKIVSIKPGASTSYFNLGLLLDTNPATRSQGLSDLAAAVYLNSSLKSRVPVSLPLPTVTPIGDRSQSTSTASNH